MSTETDQGTRGHVATALDRGRPDSGDLGSADLLVPESDDRRPTLTVVLPTLNEEEGIEECIRKIRRAIRRLGVTTEILVSDSSTDRTPEIAREMGARIVKPDKEGYGYAYRFAFRHARGEILAMGDADTTYDFEELPKLFEPVANGDADIVLGSRLDGHIAPGSMPTLHRYVGNPLLTRFLNLFYDVDVSDAHSGFRVFTRDTLEVLDLESNGMEFASEMIMEAGAKELQIEEVPITYHPREGEATLHSFRDGWRHVKFMLVNSPAYLFSIPGSLLLFSGLGIMAAMLLKHTFEGLEPSPHVMIAGSLLTIVGYQIGSFGVFAAKTGHTIRVPTDPISNWIAKEMSLELGATIGLVLFVLGASVATVLVVIKLQQDRTFIIVNLFAFTAIVVGLQTIFSSFFLRALD